MIKINRFLFLFIMHMYTRDREKGVGYFTCDVSSMTKVYNVI